MRAALVDATPEERASLLKDAAPEVMEEALVMLEEEGVKREEALPPSAPISDKVPAKLLLEEGRLDARELHQDRVHRLELHSRVRAVLLDRLRVRTCACVCVCARVCAYAPRVHVSRGCVSRVRARSERVQAAGSGRRAAQRPGRAVAARHAPR